MTGVELVVHLAAVARLALLVTSDRVAGPLRWRLIRRSYRRNLAHFRLDGWDVDRLDEWDAVVDADGVEAPWGAYLLRCPSCAGLWLAALWTGLWAAVDDVWWPVSLVLAAGLAAPVVAAGLRR